MLHTHPCLSLYHSSCYKINEIDPEYVLVNNGMSMLDIQVLLFLNAFFFHSDQQLGDISKVILQANTHCEFPKDKIVCLSKEIRDSVDWVK